jgi:hypothetical protein
MTTDGRIGIGQRLDRTPGTFAIEQSPFKRADHLIAALITKTGQMWHYRSEWIGGQGVTPCAVQADGDRLEMLYQDARGGWWLQEQIKVGVWIADIDRTLALVNRAELGDDVTSMSAEHIRNGEA